jgi:chemotaxis protein CheX
MNESSSEYSAESQGDVLIFTLRSDLNTKVATCLANDVQTALTENPALKKVVVNTRDRHMIDSLSMRVVGKLASDLKKQGCMVFVLEPHSSLRKFISDMGMSSLLNLASTLEEVVASAQAAPSPKGRLDVEFVNPFIVGTINTLKVQCSMECTAQKPTLKENLPEPVKFDIAGVIGVTSETFTGSIAICFPEKVFLGAMSNMLGEECKEINKDLEDGAGELLNIIFGHAKTVLNEKGYALAKAIPTIVRGQNLEVKHLTFATTLVLPFGTQFGNFYIEIGMESV